MDESTASNVLHVSIGWIDAFRALPAFGLVYFAWRFRKAMFANAKKVIGCGLALACLSSAGFSGYNVVKSAKIKDAWNSIAVATAQAMIDKEAAEVLDARAFAENEAKVSRWQEIVPGKWAQLYNEMRECRYYESRALALSTFVENIAPDEPKLTAVGYDRFLAIVVGDIPATISNGLSAREYDELMKKVDAGEFTLGASDVATAKRLGLCKTLLHQFVCALSENPPQGDQCGRTARSILVVKSD